MSLRILDLRSGRIAACHVGCALVIGRAAPEHMPDVVCDDPYVSRAHCVVEATPQGTLRITDRSSHGILLNDVEVEGAAEACPGDFFLLGEDYLFRVLPPGPLVRALVFSDLVDSMGLKRRIGDVAALERIARHRDVVRRLCSLEGGVEIDNAGDGFFLVFEAPAPAVGFALALQEAHADDSSLPPVRVGLHLGEVHEQRSEEGKPLLVEGLAVDLAARICSLANPGQILLTPTLYARAREVLTDPKAALVWRAHGTYLFQGMEDHPLEVSEVALERLADRLDPPAGSPKARRCVSRTEVTLRDRYRILSELGRGAMGVVYLADDLLLGRPCAIKVLITGARADAELLARFRREALLGVRLGAHPKIAAVYDLGTWPDTGELYCAVELAPGRSLRALLADGPLPPREAVDLVAQIARAAAHAHTQGVVHRDLKPANVMVSDAGEVCLLDFGIAKALQDGTGLTLTGHFLGTPGYMAPEQVDDSKRVTPAADVYALGAILEHALSGETPSAQLGWRECFLQMLSGARERPSLGAPFDEIVARAEHLEPSQRPSATELASELEAWRPEHASD